MKKSAFTLFKENNPSILVQNANGSFVIKNCWGENAFIFNFPTKHSMLCLKNTIFPKELFGIYHKDRQMYEFIYTPLAEESQLAFDYIYDNKKFRLFYGTPSEEFVKLMSYFEFNHESDVDDERIIGLLRYNMYYKAPEMKEMLHPTNFFIVGDFDKMNYSEHLVFFKHVNFMLSYYNRESPNIIIKDDINNSIGDITIPCKSKSETFPSVINTYKYDTTLLDLMKAAKEANSVRLQFIFYYQVLEYCSYYYIENSLKQKIANIIKSPDILNSDKYSQNIIEIYSEYFKQNKDEKRMERLICDLCCFDDIKNELVENHKYFTNDTDFEGGLTIKAIFNNKDEIDNTPPKDIMQTIRRNLETMRNVLVHARESRENVVIKPTSKNSELLRPYLYLIRRLAEVVIIKYE